MTRGGTGFMAMTRAVANCHVASDETTAITTAMKM